jgi:parallel beta-helix repeat protein
MKTLPGIAATALLLATAFSARAATYVVAQQATNAADTNPGTEAAPFRSIGAAVAGARPGDTVVVRTGIYRESVAWTNAAWDQPMERITLTAAPGDRPVLEGADIITNRFAPVRVALRKPPGDVRREAEYDPDAWRKRMGIIGPNAAQAPPAPAESGALDHAAADFSGLYACALDTYAQMVFADGRPLRQIGLQGSPERAEKGGTFRFRRQWDGQDVSDMLPGTFCYDARGKTLYVWLHDGSDPNAHLMEVAIRSCGLYLCGVWTVSGLDVQRYRDDSARGHAGMGIQGHHSIVENCRIRHNEFFGIMIQGHDDIMRGCEVAYNGICGLGSSFGLRMLIEGNDFRANAWRGDVLACMNGNKVHGWHESRFLRNRFRDELASALWLDINCNNALIAENTFENCALGVYFEISRWGVIANNVLRNCQLGLWSYSSDVLLAHNVIDGCGEGVRLTGMARSCNYNQSIYLFEPTAETLMAVRNNLIVNNLIIDSAGDFIGATRDDAYGWANFSDHNALVWTSPFIHWTGGHIKFMAGFDDYYGRLPLWRMDRHYDEHSRIADPALRRVLIRQNYEWSNFTPGDVLGDPRLTDRENGDYTLLPDSPLRGLGAAIPEVLNSVCPPIPYFKAIPRPWARTFVEDAPAAGRNAVADVWGHKSYRIQPLPRVHRLVDLDAAGPADPGLNRAWMRSGKYPRFRTDGPAETAGPEDFAVLPENRLANPSFTAPIVVTNAPPDAAPPGLWVTRGGAHTYVGMACANLLLPDREEQVAFQKVGPINPGDEYLLVGDMKVQSMAGGVSTEAEIRLAAGPELKPIRQAVVRAAPGQDRHWNTHELHYRAGAAGTDPHAGQDLYVVIACRTSAAAGAKPAGSTPVAFGRWDNFILLSSAPAH